MGRELGLVEIHVPLVPGQIINFFKPKIRYWYPLIPTILLFRPQARIQVVVPFNSIDFFKPPLEPEVVPSVRV